MNASQGERAGERPSGWACRCLAFCCALLSILALFCLLACTPRSDRSTAPMPTATVENGADAQRLPHTTLTQTETLTLTIWGPDLMAPLSEVPGGAVLAEQFRAFSAAHPGWRVNYVRKKPHGVGGLVHFLTATQAVAPDEMPDLVLLDMHEVGLLAHGNLLQPIEASLGAEILEDLAPFARDAGMVGSHLLAAQYNADLCFLAYNSAVVEEPPTTWAEVLTSQLIYLLPVGASDGAVCDAFLPQYLALGGRLEDRDGLPYLDRTLVEAILEVYQSAREAGLFPDVGLALEDASDCWPVYLTGSATLTNVSSWDFGRQQGGRLGSIRPGPLPTLSGTQISMSSGWGFALITRDPKRQLAATELLRALFEPSAMAAWSRATYHLPTRRSALPLAIGDPEYLHFLQRLLAVTVPQPREPAYSLASTALRDAIAGVVRGELTPAVAAQQAAEKMQAARESLQASS